MGTSGHCIPAFTAKVDVRPTPTIPSLEPAGNVDARFLATRSQWEFLRQVSVYMQPKGNFHDKYLPQGCGDTSFFFFFFFANWAKLRASDAHALNSFVPPMWFLSHYVCTYQQKQVEKEQLKDHLCSLCHFLPTMISIYYLHKATEQQAHPNVIRLFF